MTNISRSHRDSHIEDNDKKYVKKKERERHLPGY